MTVKDKVFLEEFELVLAIKRKDENGSMALHDMYQKPIKFFVGNIVSDPEIMKDVVQEVFFKIWTSIDSYDSSKGRLFTWIMTLARNTAIDKIRSAGYKKSLMNISIEESYYIVDKHKSVIMNTDVIDLRRIVLQLREEWVILIDMVYFQGYTQAQVAEELGIPLGTVKTRITMAIKELRKIYIDD